jgi:hypothetical protein
LTKRQGGSHGMVGMVVTTGKWRFFMVFWWYGFNGFRMFYDAL